jgi:hypothetical protein
MKKAIIILLVLYCQQLAAQSRIKLSSNVELGYENRTVNIWKFPDPKSFELNNTMFGTMEMAGNFKGFSIYSNTRTYFIPESIVSYDPVQVEFRIGTRYEYKNISIGYEHLCSHSIDTELYQEGYNRFSVKFKLF